MVYEQKSNERMEMGGPADYLGSNDLSQVLGHCVP